MSIRRDNKKDKKDRIKIVITNDCSNPSTKKINVDLDESTQNNDEVFIEEVDPKIDGKYKRFDLHELTVKNLKKISKKYDIPTKGNKDQIADKIFKWLSNDEYKNQYIKLKNHISEVEPNKKSELHTIYYEKFNAEDKFNKELLGSLPRYITKHWRHKLSLALIFVQLLNSFAIFCEHDEKNDISKNQFLEKIALHFLTK